MMFERNRQKTTKRNIGYAAKDFAWLQPNRAVSGPWVYFARGLKNTKLVPRLVPNHSKRSNNRELVKERRGVKVINSTLSYHYSTLEHICQDSKALVQLWLWLMISGRTHQGGL